MKNKDITIEELFNDFYNKVYTRWRVNKEKAAKDIVGEEYELFRQNFYNINGFDFGEKKDVFGSGVNTDICVIYNNQVVIIEEDKGSYVDGTFLSRALMDAAKIISTCIEKNKPCPYFILSSPTTMKNYEKSFNENINLFRDEIKQVLLEKYIYLPLTESSRVKRNIYFKNEKNHFILSEECLNKQKNILEKIKKEYGV